MRIDLRQTTPSLKNILTMAVLLFTALPALSADSVSASTFAQGLANYNSKNYGDAKKTLSSYLQTNPNDYKAHFYLANSLVKLGKLDDASSEYKKVLTLTPDSKTGTASMEAFNKIADMHCENVAKTPTIAHLPPPPTAQITQNLGQFPQTQLAAPTPAQQIQPTPYNANSQFGYGRNFQQNAGNSNDLIPSSVLGSGARLSPTVASPGRSSFSNRNRSQNQSYNPYANNGPSGQAGGLNFTSSGYGNTGYGNSGYGNSGIGNFRRMHRHGRRFQNGYSGGNQNFGYPGDAGRFHTGGYIQNYEITDTPSGNAVPLLAEQKKFEDLATETTGTQSGIAASKAAKKQK